MLISGLNGYRKGLFISVFSLASLMASLYLALAYGKAVAGYIDSYFNAVAIISEHLQGDIPILGWNPDHYIDNTRWSIGAAYWERFFANIGHWFSKGDFYLQPAEYLARALLTVGGFLLVFVLAYITLNIVISFINKLVFQGLAVNRLGGMMVSFGKTGLLLAGFLIFIVPLIKMGVYIGNQPAVWAMGYINSSLLLNRLQQIIDFIQIMLI